MPSEAAAVPGPGHIVATFAAVMLATAGTLGVLNTIPGWLGNNPFQVRSAATVSAAEQRLGQGVWLPAYYPQWLAWPPAAVRYVTGPPSIVGLELRAHDTGEPALVFVQASAPDARVPERMLPPAPQLDAQPARVSGHPATVATVQVPDAGRWRELSWSDGRSRFVMRYRGHDPDVLRMARTLRKERP